MGAVPHAHTSGAGTSTLFLPPYIDASLHVYLCPNPLPFNSGLSLSLHRHGIAYPSFTPSLAPLSAGSQMLVQGLTPRFPRTPPLNAFVEQLPTACLSTDAGVSVCVCMCVCVWNVITTDFLFAHYFSPADGVPCWGGLPPSAFSLSIRSVCISPPPLCVCVCACVGVCLFLSLSSGV